MSDDEREPLDNDEMPDPPTDEDSDDEDYDDGEKRTPKPKKTPKNKGVKRKGNPTPGKKLTDPLDKIPENTLKARLRTINDKKLPRFEKIAVEHAQALFDLGGEFNELFHQNETVLTLFFLQS